LIKNVLITGANGQDGKILLKKLLKKKNLFLIAKKFQKKLKTKNIKFFEFNLGNKKKLEFFFKNNKVDIILHLAANNPSFNQNNYKLHYSENMSNSKNIVNLALKYNKKVKFISCSSSRIFKKKNGIVSEKSSLEDNDFYSKFRISMNNYLIDLKEKKRNLDFINVILFNHDSLFRNNRFLLPRIVTALIHENKKFINNIVKENIVMDFSHADDICNALIKLIFTNKKIKNIILSSGNKTYVNDIIKFLIKKYKINLKLINNKIKPSYCIVGKNNYAKKIINWKIKKNIYLAAKELYIEKLREL